MFHREKLKCFGETENYFVVNHQTLIVLEGVQNFWRVPKKFGRLPELPESTCMKTPCFPNGAHRKQLCISGGEMLKRGSLLGTAPTRVVMDKGDPLGASCPLLRGNVDGVRATFWAAILHPSSNINRGGELLSISVQVLTQMDCSDLPLSPFLHERVPQHQKAARSLVEISSRWRSATGQATLYVCNRIERLYV